MVFTSIEAIEDGEVVNNKVKLDGRRSLSSNYFLFEADDVMEPGSTVQIYQSASVYTSLTSINHLLEN